MCAESVHVQKLRIIGYVHMYWLYMYVPSIHVHVYSNSHSHCMWLIVYGACMFNSCYVLVHIIIAYRLFKKVLLLRIDSLR